MGKAPNDPVTRVDLMPLQSVASGGRKRVMVVVPSFPQTEDAENNVVSAVVSHREGLRSPEVTHRVDAPRDMMNEEDPDKASPQETEESTHPAAMDATKQGGDEQANGHPHGERGAHPT